MANSIQVNRKDFIKQLSSINYDNVGIAGITIDRARLIQALKLQTQPGAEVLTLNYGRVKWEVAKDTTYYQVDEPSIQFSCNHTVMRFLNRPKVKYGEPKVKHLNFVESLDQTKTELSGVELDTQVLITALTFVLPCVAIEVNRPVLNCVLFDCQDDTITLVTADGFRLGVVKVSGKGIPANKVLIDSSDIIKLIKFLKSNTSGKGKSKTWLPVYVSFTDDKVTFSADTGVIEFDRQLGDYPDYTALIPKDGTKIEVIASAMLGATKTLTTIAKDGSNIIRMQFQQGQPGKAMLTAKSEELGDSSAECDAIVEADCKIGINGNYLIDILKVCGDSRITLKLTTPSSPMVFELDGKIEVIMPMFVQW